MSFVEHHFRWNRRYWIQEDSVLFQRLKNRKTPYQNHNIECLRDFCRYHFNVKHIVDIGMNIGMMSTEFSTFAQHVTGFEPDQELFEYAKLNFALNGVTNITCFNVALGDVEGKHRFMKMKKDGAKNKLATDGNKNRSDADIIEVPIRTLDSYRLQDVDVIKIDTEGSEFRIILGAVATIQSMRPIVQVELLPEYLRMWKHTPQQVFDFFASLDYIPTNANRLILPKIWEYKRGLCDVFFIPKEKYTPSYFDNNFIMDS